jgi:hypothetical protein
MNEERPDIPNSILPAVKSLICECWEILTRLEEMKFKTHAQSEFHQRSQLCECNQMSRKRSGN